MTGMIIRLHLTLWRRMVRANPAVLVMMLFVGFYGLIGLASSGFFLYTGAHGGPHSYIAGVIAAGVLGYITLMALMPSGEQQVSARDFATLPVRPEQVRAGLLGVTSLQSRPVVALLCTVITGTILCVAATSATTVLVALPMLLVSLCTTVLAGDVVARAAGRGSSGGTDRKAILSGLGFILVILGFSFFVNYGEGIPFDTLGAILAWTPLGATGGVIGAVLGGRWGVAVAQAAIALATLAVLGWLWLRGVRVDMEEPQMRGAAVTRKKKVRKDADAFPSVLLPGLPYTPAAAIFSRAVRYLRRDSRLAASFIALPFVSIFFLYQGISSGSFVGYYGLFFMGIMVSAMCSNDFGYDGPGGWLHLTSGVSPRTLVLARHAASAVPVVLFGLLYAAVVLVFFPDRTIALLVTVVALGYLISGAAAGLMFTAYNPYATSRPGTNSWSDRSGYSSAAMASSLGFMFLGWVPVVPGVVMILAGHNGVGAWLTALGCLTCVAIPVAAYAVILRGSVRRVEQQWPEIYAKVRSWVN
ncbi:hypothetical protein V5S96_08465 [Corynebacterium mastitidis]|uniref:ABC transporter permease n=1 Tax=Corynebacterium mastitidis TaxID=161890 RepID=A0ABU8P1B8_9CORY